MIKGKSSDVVEVVVMEDQTGDDKKLIGKRSHKLAAAHLTAWIALTIYAAFLFTRGREKPGFVVAILVYIFISLRLLAQHVSVSQLIYTPLGRIFDATVVRGVGIVPAKWRLWIMAAALIVTAAIVSGASPATSYGNFWSRIQSLAGTIILILILWATSADRKNVKWRIIVPGMVLQYIIALFVLKTQAGVDIFSFVSHLITNFLELSKVGFIFLFGPVKSINFVIAVFPAIVFFCSFISVVYYFGGMQYIIAKMAWLMVRLMDTSGAESVVAAASPFVGQGESALLVKPFVEYMTKSELHSVMTSGFSTIAGSVLLAYVNLGFDPSIILTACVMSIPTSLAVSKLRLPESEESLTKGQVKIPENHDQEEANFLHAAGNGAATGVQLILLIGGSLLSLVSLFAFADFIFGWIFQMVDVYDTFNGPLANGDEVWVSIKLALSFVFFPVAWLIGIPVNDCRKAAEFMSLKMVVNEFMAYSNLHDYVEANPHVFDERTVKLLAFALCGFANVASIGIQIGCLSVMGPSRGKDLAKLAVSAMITGTVSTWLCASVAGTLL